MTEIGKIVGLKCPNCGAALPETDKDLQKCKYCGMTVHIEDANKYLEHLKGFIIEWMRTALPLGIGTAYSSSVDPLARHNIFVQSILPRLNSEFGMVQIDAFEAFSTPLIAPPFIRRPNSAKCQRDTKSLFSYDAKIASIQPFAISPEDQTAIQKMGGISRALAHVLIGLDVLNQNQSGSYKVVAENFAVASKSLEPQYEVLSQRLNALSEIYLSIDELLSKNLVKTKSRVNEAIAVLEDAKSKSACDINLSICTNAIEEEIEVGNTVLRIADLMESIGGSDELDVVSKIARYFQAASSFSTTLPLNWRSIFENVGRYSELTKWFSLILNAKRGSPTLKTTYGPGSTLFPFWVTNVSYTFGTGALWMKKGISVNENALIAATFPSDQNFAYAPSEVVTDIFSGRPYGTIGSSITGSEASISIGEGIRRIVQSSRLASVSGYRVVPPLSTISEAKHLMNEYLQQVSMRLQGKMQIASSDVSELLFVPADLSTGFINFYGTLGYIQPKSMGEIATINSVLI